MYSPIFTGTGQDILFGNDRKLGYETCMNAATACG